MVDILAFLGLQMFGLLSNVGDFFPNFWSPYLRVTFLVSFLCLRHPYLNNDCKAWFPLAKVSAITPATAARDSTFLGHFRRHDRDRIISIFCHAVRGAYGEYNCTVACHCCCHFLLKNTANVQGAYSQYFIFFVT